MDTPSRLRKIIIPETERLIDAGVRLALTVLVAFLIQQLLFLIVGRAERFLMKAGGGSQASIQRAHTLGQIFRNLCTLVVASAAMVHALEILGWNVGPLLAGAGFLGVALGFGAQSWVRDVIAGVFILAENQFSVGELIEADGKAATVEALTVRCTTLRDFNGYLHFVPNGEMKTVVNRSRGWNRLAVDAIVGSDQDLDAALAAVRSALEDLNGDSAWRDRLLEPVVVWGVESLAAQEAAIRMVVRAQPGADGPEVARELRLRIHRALSEAGIKSAPSREMVLVTPAPATPPAEQTLGT